MQEEENFKTAKELIEILNINYNPKLEKQKEEFLNVWQKIADKKLLKYSKAERLDDEGVLIIACKNSKAANEIFKKKQIYNSKIKKIADEQKIFFKYIRIVYK